MGDKYHLLGEPREVERRMLPHRHLRGVAETLLGELSAEFPEAELEKALAFAVFRLAGWVAAHRHPEGHAERQRFEERKLEELAILCAARGVDAGLCRGQFLYVLPVALARYREAPQNASAWRGAMCAVGRTSAARAANELLELQLILRFWLASTDSEAGVESNFAEVARMDPFGPGRFYVRDALTVRLAKIGRETLVSRRSDARGRTILQPTAFLVRAASIWARIYGRRHVRARKVRWGQSHSREDYLQTAESREAACASSRGERLALPQERSASCSAGLVGW